jgi:IMP dehydrogenase
MELSLSFDDVLITPKFSKISSRKDVDISTKLCSQKMLPIISSNMDTITSSEMTHAMFNYPNLEGPGARGCLHRFWSIEENLKAFKESATQTWVSFGLGAVELERAEALKHAGAITFVLDVAHGASSEVVKQVNNFRDLVGYLPSLVVGNFATGKTIEDFKEAAGEKHDVDAYKIGIGGGSACTTRVVTGCGLPTLASLLSCSRANVNLIADGGMRTSGDIAKSLAVPNVKAVMLGGMLAGTEESSGLTTYKTENFDGIITTKAICKEYRGSASKESYATQEKLADWRTAEGESFLVPYKGSVKEILQQIDAGLRSSFSYVGANNLKEYQQLAEFVQITNNGVKESGAHGRKN